MILLDCSKMSFILQNPLNINYSFKMNLEVYKYTNLSSMEKNIADNNIEEVTKINTMFLSERDFEIAAYYGSEDVLEYFMSNVPEIVSPIVNIIYELTDNTHLFITDEEQFETYVNSNEISENDKVITLRKTKFPSIDVSFDVLSSYFTNFKRISKRMFDVFYDKYSWEEWESYFSTYNPHDAIFKCDKMMVMLEYFHECGHKIRINSMLMSKIFRYAFYDILDCEMFSFPSTFYKYGHEDEHFSRLLIQNGTVPVPVKNL